MRKLFNATKRTRVLALVSTFLFSFMSFGDSPELMVRSVKGNAFLVTKEQTSILKPGDHIYDFQQVFTEVGSQITLANYQDQVFHLAGGGNIRSLNGVIELQNGYLWMESITGKSPTYQIQTPNGIVEFTTAEAIVDFDNSSGKTQLLVLSGKVEFSNLFQDYLKTDVSSGKFSFISKDYENGAPRTPTPVGKNTFAKVQNLFEKPRMEKKKTKVADTKIASILSSQDLSVKPKSRAIASVPMSEPTIIEVPKPKTKIEDSGIIYIRPKKRDIAKDTMLLNYHSKNIVKLKAKKVKKKFAPDYTTKSNVKVYVFGQKKKAAKRSIASVPKKRASNRAPASISTGSSVKLKNDVFEKSLTREYKKQLRHSKEVNSLIQELKNYDQDYKQSY